MAANPLMMGSGGFDSRRRDDEGRAWSLTCLLVGFSLGDDDQVHSPNEKFGDGLLPQGAARAAFGFSPGNWPPPVPAK